MSDDNWNDITVDEKLEHLRADIKRVWFTHEYLSGEVEALREQIDELKKMCQNGQKTKQ